MANKRFNKRFTQNKTLTLSSVVVALSLLSGCESTVKTEDAIMSNPQWDKQTQEHIRNGMVFEGMSKVQVTASWGKRCDTCPGTKVFDWGETWEYPTQIVFFDQAGKVTKTMGK